MDGPAEIEARLRALMIASLDGDATAYRQLLRDADGRLRRYFARRLHGGLVSAAEDLTQETLMAIHARRMTYDREQPFTAWLFAIARYKLIDFLRRQRIRVTVPLEDEALLIAENTGDPTAAHDVETLLADVKPRDRELIRKVRLEGNTVADAAASVGMTETAAKVSIHRSLKALMDRVSGGRR